MLLHSILLIGKYFYLTFLYTLLLILILKKFINFSDMFCAGRVPEEDLKRTLKACGGAVMSTVHDLNDSVLGRCELFEERQIGGERYNVFTGCPNAKTCTIIIRGGAEQFLEETERSLHDAIMIVRRYVEFLHLYACCFVNRFWTKIVQILFFKTPIFFISN